MWNNRQQILCHHEAEGRLEWRQRIVGIAQEPVGRLVTLTLKLLHQVVIPERRFYQNDVGESGNTAKQPGTLVTSYCNMQS